MILKGFYVLSFLAVVGFCISAFVLMGRERKVDKFMEKVRKMKKEIDPEFNKISKYYINLDRSVYRRDYMEEQIERLGIENIERIPGVDGKKLENEEKGVLGEFKFQVNFEERKFKKGEIGCTLSHLRSIRRAYEKGDDFAIIMEDDILLDMTKAWNFNFSEIIDKISKEVEIVNLSTNTTPKQKDGMILESYNNSPESRWTCSYLVTRMGMEKIVKNIDPNNIFFDTNLVADIYLYEKLSSYILRPSIFIPDVSTNDSTIRNYKYFNSFLQNNYKVLKYGKYI
jgi:GR25 family glycosyltransferase involved in LPS biosynthesis